jgi:hypothetical protein
MGKRKAAEAALPLESREVDYQEVTSGLAEAAQQDPVPAFPQWDEPAPALSENVS